MRADSGRGYALLKVGILQETENGPIVFPFDAVRVDFMLKAARTDNEDGFKHRENFW
jgi:hypothetical protein